MTMHGYGYGYGYGDGYGYGYGYGDGYGDGHGYGDGYGDGHGYGDGYGDGHGDGYGKTIGRIGDRKVVLLSPWMCVSVGCQCHSVAYWRNNWRRIAKNESVSISQSEVEELLCRASSCVAEQTADASSSVSANPSQ